MGGKCSKSKPPGHIEPSRGGELGGDADVNKNSQPQQIPPIVVANAEGESFAIGSSSAASASASSFASTSASSIIIVDNRLVANTENQAMVEATLANLLDQTDSVMFNKPDLQIFNEFMLYQITLGQANDTVAMYVVKRSPSRFQPRRDIILLTSDGQTVLRFMNPKRLLHVRMNEDKCRGRICIYGKIFEIFHKICIFEKISTRFMNFSSNGRNISKYV